MGATVTVRNEVLDKVLRNVDFTYTDTYISLHTAEPDDTGSNEVSGGSYARQIETWNAAASAQITNDGEIRFDDMPAVTVTHVGIFDAASAGNFIWQGALDSSRTVEAGDNAIIPDTQLTVSIT